MPKLHDLIMLLRKISETDEKTRVEIDFDGKEFRWKVPVSNMTAEQFVPKKKVDS